MSEIPEKPGSADGPREPRRPRDAGDPHESRGTWDYSPGTDRQPTGRPDTTGHQDTTGRTDGADTQGGAGTHGGADTHGGAGTHGGASRPGDTGQDGAGTGRGGGDTVGPGGPDAPWRPAPGEPWRPIDPFGRLAKAAWQTVLVAGIAALVLGVLVLLWPGVTLVVVGVFFGVYLLVSGIAQLVAAFGTHTTAALRVMAFISGALSVLLGLFCFRGALQSILLLALWIGIGWLFRGITQTVAAASDPQMPARGWQIFLGMVSALAGVVLMVSPLESVTVLTVVGGCWLLAVGLVETGTALRVRHRLARQRHGEHKGHSSHTPA